MSSVEVMSDNYVDMKLALVRGGEGKVMSATVKTRMNDDEGNPIGTAQTNRLLDSRQYEVE